jgi:alpha-D-ribose 1-methylphosphonate 5-triphosphate synthase subunit PhnG
MNEHAAAAPMTDPTPRQRWMAVLARAEAGRLAELLAGVPALPDSTVLRGPESGLVMLRGRAGGGGGPFNLGEMSVTRCTVRNADGFVGHGYVQGRDMRRARLAAEVDAAMQDLARHDGLEAAVIAPLAAEQQAARDAVAAKAAATKVQFFTMATMRTS